MEQLLGLLQTALNLEVAVTAKEVELHVERLMVGAAEVLMKGT